MKRIAIFCDGTWNSPDDEESTSVLQMARAVRPTAGGSEQVVFYDWGVGTDRKKIQGGLSGEGIDKNIIDCYRFLVHNYRKNDQLFFFGFSRGAYTVRSLAGFIRNCGLLKREHAQLIPQAYKLYRKRSKASSPDSPTATAFRSRYSVANITLIEFVGVWDTVGALGIPLPFWGTLGEKEFLFHDTAPSKIVRHARHAVSIDENRVDFEATLWDDKPGLDLKQVWFAGVHGDVGGGYRDAGLGHCASHWMLKEAQSCGLKFEPHFSRQLNPDPTAKMHDGRKGIFKARPTTQRQITGPVHESVWQRWQDDTDNYQAKSRALKKLVDDADGDWAAIEIEGA